MSEKNLAIPAQEKVIDEQRKFTLAMARRWQELIDRLEDHEARITALEP
jgi:hypothetical protein